MCVVIKCTHIEELRLLGYNAVQSGENQPTFREEYIASIFKVQE
jgi:hypothetical protein